MRVIEVLASCRQGMTRKEIMEKLKLKSGGTLTKVLSELINCDFVRGYNTRDKKIKQKDQIFQLTDLYTLFYMTFCHPGTTDTGYWTHLMGNLVKILGMAWLLSEFVCCIFLKSSISWG